MSATYTITSGQLYIVHNCSNLNKISLSNAMIWRITQKSVQFLFEKLGVRDHSNFRWRTEGLVFQTYRQIAMHKKDIMESNPLGLVILIAFCLRAIVSIIA